MYHVEKKEEGGGSLTRLNGTWQAIASPAAARRAFAYHRSRRDTLQVKRIETQHCAASHVAAGRSNPHHRARRAFYKSPACRAFALRGSPRHTEALVPLGQQFAAEQAVAMQRPPPLTIEPAGLRKNPSQ